MFDLDLLSWLESTAHIVLDVRREGREYAIKSLMDVSQGMPDWMLGVFGQPLVDHAARWVDKAIVLGEKVECRRDQPLNFAAIVDELATENGEENCFSSDFEEPVMDSLWESTEKEATEEERFIRLLAFYGRRVMVAYVDELWAWDPPFENREAAYTMMVDILNVMADEMALR